MAASELQQQRSRLLPAPSASGRTVLEAPSCMLPYSQLRLLRCEIHYNLVRKPPLLRWSFASPLAASPSKALFL
jgi:hypothetical protein